MYSVNNDSCIDVCVGVLYKGDEQYPLEVGVLSTVDEVNDDLKDEPPQKRGRGGGGDNKDESFIVSLHGLPYNATLEDVTEFLEGLQFAET